MPIAPPPDQAFLAWMRGIDAHLRGDSAGQLVPSNVYPFSPIGGSAPPSSSWYIPVTAPAFDGSLASQTWICGLDRLVTTGLRVDVPWTTDAATSGEVRLTIPGAGNSPTTAVVLAAGSSGTASFKWVHGGELWTPAGLVWVYIEARRTLGSGNVNIGYPRSGAVQCEPAGCTPSGQ